jgi:solute carrier family 50 protein (sugar transporter)
MNIQLTIFLFALLKIMVDIDGQIFYRRYPTLRQVQKDRSVGNLPLLPYSSMIANCVTWFLYGILTKQTKVWFTNLVGLFFGLFYFLKFIKYTQPKSTSLPGTVRQHLQGCLAIFAGSAVWILACYLTVHRKDMWMPYAAGLIGNTAVMFCLLMFASPLSALRTVLRKRSAKSIPLPFTLATILNCFLWSVAGLGEFKDFNFDYGSSTGIKNEDQIDLVA